MAGLTVRSLTRRDLDAVVRIDALHTGASKRRYWKGVFQDFVTPAPRRGRVGLGAAPAGGLAAYLFGEVRAFEYGSPPCGWIFAVGVDPRHLRAGVATALLEEGWPGLRGGGAFAGSDTGGP